MPTEQNVMTVEKMHEERQKTIVFRLDTRSPSSTLRKRKDGNTDAKDRLDTAITFSVPITGKEPSPTGDAMLRTIYIPGAPTRFIDDVVDANGNVIEKGLKSRGWDKDAITEGKKRALRQNVHFKWGQLVLNTYGDNALLVEYLKNHEFCADSPHFDRMTLANKGGLIKWHIDKPEQEAEEKLVGISIDHEITSLLVKLAKPAGKTMEYDFAKIDALLTMFGIGGGIPPAEYARKVLAITAFAKENPAKFLSHYNSETALYRDNVAQAVNIKVIDISGANALFVDGKKEFYTFVSKSTSDKYDELVLHFLGKTGMNNYQTMLIKTEAEKKLKALK